MHYLFTTEDYIYFPNTNFPIKDAKQTKKITSDPIFSTVFISSPMQQARLPALTDFQLVEEDEVSCCYEAPRFSYTEK